MFTVTGDVRGERRLRPEDERTDAELKGRQTRLATAERVKVTVCRHFLAYIYRGRGGGCYHVGRARKPEANITASRSRRKSGVPFTRSLYARHHPPTPPSRCR